MVINGCKFEVFLSITAEDHSAFNCTLPTQSLLAAKQKLPPLQAII